ncbi:[FeFe] hydrogenase H-cluster maturation GTPase HydF [Qiania dongpingensis]|uniref:[FeFe] hydrogenase H-cluster maturation GTPase HydF n=1 Tax=Qiania dongpingensis TaxID=2763669 RepID=A0A7G9G3L4_9FIRM|nr:[FeFe] hydrogenase H-cluster maturation GTPase HydF [Qiania dongpingensis]QNM05396.1 [FeFe] hydrogenase H-cluster maturation GTPase HydF [Qiania dongpingensis]
MGMDSTPRSNRLHIGIFGRRNVGKSTLVNALTGQETSLVSDVAGTTTDPVYKAVELRGFGPAVFIDTAGFDDEGVLGSMRVGKTKEAMTKTDVAVILFDSLPGEEIEWAARFTERKTPVIAAVNKICRPEEREAVKKAIRDSLGLEALELDLRTGAGVEALKRKIVESAPENFWDVSLTGGLAGEGDLVLLVMPQDIQAPKGRLILPQVQTIRELLDKKSLVMSCTADKMEMTLKALVRPPRLIITDSQAFAEVYRLKPEESMLTSFSVLFAGYKGDIREFLRGAEAIEGLTESSRVLIAEACAHSPTEEDIGRIKIPKLLRRHVGRGLCIDFVRGVDFPKDLSRYNLVIHCAACMFNRKYVMERMEAARRQGVAISNYGIVIAYLNGILDKISFVP